MNIIDTMLNATDEQLRRAVLFTSDMLHVPGDEITTPVAVAYVMKHYGGGRVGGPEVQGWDGFILDIGNNHGKESSK